MPLALPSPALRAAGAEVICQDNMTHVPCMLEPSFTVLAMQRPTWYACQAGILRSAARWPGQS